MLKAQRDNASSCSETEVAVMSFDLYYVSFRLLQSMQNCRSCFAMSSINCCVYMFPLNRYPFSIINHIKISMSFCVRLSACWANWYLSRPSSNLINTTIGLIDIHVMRAKSALAMELKRRATAINVPSLVLSMGTSYVITITLHDDLYKFKHIILLSRRIVGSPRSL